MSRSRERRRNHFAVFGIGLVVLSIFPNQVGFQDLGALLARRPEVAERWRKHVIASPFGTIHAAMFSMPRPLGMSTAPPLYVLASVDPNEVTSAIGRNPFLENINSPVQFPSVNRKRKADALVKRPREPLPQLSTPETIPAPVAKSEDRIAPGQPAETNFDEHNEYIAVAPAESDVLDSELPPHDLPIAAATENPETRLYFDVGVMKVSREEISPWKRGEEPIVVLPPVPHDPEVKLSALTTPDLPLEDSHGETIAPKGVVTGEGQRPMSPAERLKLTGAARAKAEKCLANAVYFEARDEPVRAQIAVAQVVLNRVFSPYYPNDVCGVVYQNAHRHLACQFTFACDGKPDIVTEPDAWVRAKRISAEMLDGKLWMPAVAKSTHYHDDWAHPGWVREMRRMDKLGGLIFYRPRNWGDGAEEPNWGDPKTTAKAAEALQLQ
ncbi:MAG: cell wall hydrolase [Pseudolabrys sp.]|nr:cell wall hydrolase [Pseudolabrys sp.]